MMGTDMYKHNRHLLRGTSKTPFEIQYEDSTFLSVSIPVFGWYAC